jgi:osmotically-inducible protein OsmY
MQYFKWQNSINPSNVKVDANKGEVVLSGFVSKQSESIAAEKIANSTKGVIHVDNQIKIQPEMVNNDKTIKEELQNSFEKSALIDQQKIESEVSKGIVYLSGCVANDPIRKEIEEQALHVKGVNEVINKITVE